MTAEHAGHYKVVELKDSLDLEAIEDAMDRLKHSTKRTMVQAGIKSCVLKVELCELVYQEGFDLEHPRSLEDYKTEYISRSGPPQSV